MATYTSNYGWTKPSGSDNVDISVLNDNLDDQDSTIHDAFLNMAPPFSESSTYAVDDIVLYTTGLYKCHTAVVTPGSWTGSTNWQVYKLSEGGSGGGGTSNYNDLTNKPSINGVTLSGNKTTNDLGINADNVMMSDGVTSVEDAITSIGSVLYEYTAGANETWSSALDHLYGHTGLNTAILMPNIGLTFMPSILDRFGTIYINSSGKLITAAIHLKQSGSMYRENAADSTTVSDLGLNAFTQGYKMQVIKLY